MAPKKATAKAKPKVAAMKSKAEKAKAANVKAKDKEPKAILDVAHAGTDMVEEGHLCFCDWPEVQGYQWKVRRCSTRTAALAEHQQFMHHARNTCHACAQGHVQSSCNAVANYCLCQPLSDYHTMDGKDKRS